MPYKKKSATYSDLSSIKPKPMTAAPKKPKPMTAKAKESKFGKPKPMAKKATPKTSPKSKSKPKGRQTHTGSITQLGKGTRSQLEAMGYIETPKKKGPRGGRR